MKNKILGSFFSSTMWFGLLLMLATWLENNTQMLSGLVDGQYASLVGYGIGLAVWGLRWVTTKPVEQKRPSAPKMSELDKALRDDELDMY